MCEDNLLLVNTVKKYQCLYNYSIPEYLRKEDTDTAWIEVANHMGMSVHECKEKWRNLRYSFLRSLKPHPGGAIKKKYYLHNEMAFLIPFMKRKIDGAATLQYEEESDDEDTNPLSNIRNGDDTNTAEESVNNLDFATIEFRNAEPMIKRRKTTPSPHTSTRYYNGGPECPRKMFLLGLLPEINSLDEDQMKLFRRKVFTLLDNITDNSSGENNTHESTRSSENARKANYSAAREFITLVKTEPPIRKIQKQSVLPCEDTDDLEMS